MWTIISNVMAAEPFVPLESAWAHSPSPPVQPEPQSLLAHLGGVARLAREFGEAFGAGDYAELAAWLHDVGKMEPDFQARIRRDRDLPESAKQPHAFHGASVALLWEAPCVAFSVGGHHAGLHDQKDLLRWVECYESRAQELSDRLRALSLPRPTPFPSFIRTGADGRPTPDGWRSFEFFTRFVFSALVDADRLDTQAHAEGRRAPLHEPPPLDAESRLERLMAHLGGKSTLGALNAIRAEILAHCLDAAPRPPGLFSLTVPTGGGKTLSSMGFALRHAQQHGHRRVIVVIPYLSIIEQNADVLRQALGEDAVLEHHSQAVPALPADGTPAETVARKRAAENWDAPVIVTTSVQFFESLFSRAPSDCRKLHRIARSVIILDEVQTFPPKLLPPILDALAELASPARPYGCTVVLCTATQPAFKRRAGFAHGLGEVREIVPTPSTYFAQLRRVRYRWPAQEERTSLAELAAVIAQRSQVLAIVNTRSDCRALYEEVLRQGGERSFQYHLSTWMTPSHRRRVLGAVRDGLAAGEPCRLISTQCVEAGVDIDFPVVFRALGPYDAIAQAAGRCNREMRLGVVSGAEGGGEVVVFRLEGGGAPRGAYGAAIAETEGLLGAGAVDPDDPDTFLRYFARFYGTAVPERSDVQRHRLNLRFAEVSSAFRMIPEQTRPVLVPHEEEAAEVLRQARLRGFFTRDDWRLFQRYTVGLHRDQIVNGGAETALNEDESLYLWPAGRYDDSLNGTGLLFGPRPPEDFLQ